MSRVTNAAVASRSRVSRDVPPYAVVLGNPARVIKYRFSEETIARLLAEKWWERDLDELADRLGEFQTPLDGDRETGARRLDGPPRDPG